MFKSFFMFMVTALSNQRGEVATGGSPKPAAPEPVVDPAKASYPGHVAEPAVPVAGDFASMIPAEFKDKSWVKETKDLPGLLKRTDDLISELGKRPGAIPQDNAKPEEWQAFNKAFGVPEKPEGYEFSPVPEGVQTSPEWQKSVQAMLHKANISAKQFKAIEPVWNEMMVEMGRAAGANAAQLDKDFDKLADTTFGDRKDKALANSKAMIDKYAPEAVKAHAAQLSNENLIIVAGVIDGIINEYVSEDQIPNSGGSAGGASGEEAKRAQALELMKSAEFRDAFNPKHKETVAKVNALYESFKK